MRRWIGSLIATVTLAIPTACRGAPETKGAIEITDDAHHVTRLANPARRVVSLIPATTELLFAIGAGPLVVGRTRWCDYPASVTQIADVGDGMSPNIEAVLARQPDLVVLYRSTSNQATAERLRGLGIATIEAGVDTEADFARIAHWLGVATGRERSADSMVAALRAGLDSVTVTPADPPTVFILAWEQPPMTLGAGSFLSQLIRRAGGRNLFDDLARSSATINVEAVAARDPDFILTADVNEPAIAKRPEWRPVRAVREGRFLRVTGSEFNRPSPRMPAAILTLRRALEATPR